MLSQALGVLAFAGLAAAGICKPHTTSTPTSGWETAYTATAASDVAAAAATAKTSSPTSHVRGKAFNRLVIVWFENENYDKADGDRELPLNPPSAPWGTDDGGHSGDVAC